MLHKDTTSKLHLKWLVIYPQELSSKNSVGNNIIACNYLYNFKMLAFEMFQMSLRALKVTSKYCILMFVLKYGFHTKKLKAQ